MEEPLKTLKDSAEETRKRRRRNNAIFNFLASNQASRLPPVVIYSLENF